MHSLIFLAQVSSSHQPDFLVHSMHTFHPGVVARFGSFLDQSTNDVDSFLVQRFFRIPDLVTNRARSPVDIATLEELRFVEKVRHQASCKAEK